MEHEFEIARQQQSTRERWHIGKEIPAAVLLVLLAQLVGGIWWLATLSYKLDSAIMQLAEYRTDRYTKDDGRRDRELIVQIVESLRQRDAEHERRLDVLETRQRGGLMVPR